MLCLLPPSHPGPTWIIAVWEAIATRALTMPRTTNSGALSAACQGVIQVQNPALWVFFLWPFLIPACLFWFLPKSTPEGLGSRAGSLFGCCSREQKSETKENHLGKERKPK